MAVKGLWERLGPLLVAADLTQGELSSTRAASAKQAAEEGEEAVGELEVEGAGQWRVSRRQSQVLRYNCADSLDRTNLWSFPRRLTLSFPTPCCSRSPSLQRFMQSG